QRQVLLLGLEPQRRRHLRRRCPQRATDHVVRFLMETELHVAGTPHHLKPATCNSQPGERMKRQPLDHIPSDLLTPADYGRLARDFVDHPAYEYIAGGAGSEITACRNRAAFNDLQILPRILRDLRAASTALTLLGQAFRHPILLAPVAHQRLVHPELGTASSR